MTTELGADSTGTEGSEPSNPGGDGKRDYQSRINQLVGQRKAVESELGGLRSEMAELKSQLSDMNSAPIHDPLKPASFADLDQTTIVQNLSDAISNADGNTASQLVLEAMRRGAEHGAGSAEKKIQTQYQQQQVNQSIQTEIQNRFASDLSDPSGELRQNADRYAGFFRQGFGADAIEQRPELVLLSLALAKLDSAIPVRDSKIEDLTKQVEELRDAERASASLRGVTQMDEGVREAMKQGNVRDALKQLPIVQGLARG